MDKIRTWSPDRRKDIRARASIAPLSMDSHARFLNVTSTSKIRYPCMNEITLVMPRPAGNDQLVTTYLISYHDIGVKGTLGPLCRSRGRISASSTVSSRDSTVYKGRCATLLHVAASSAPFSMVRLAMYVFAASPLSVRHILLYRPYIFSFPDVMRVNFA